MKRLFIYVFLLSIAISIYSLDPTYKEEVICPIIGDYAISSGLGHRVDPIENSGGQIRFHRGVDFAAPEGTPVVAILSGVVIDHWLPPGYYNGIYYSGHEDFGGAIYIQDQNGITIYGHFSETFVKEGQYIKQGDLIGRVGSTGKSTGNHLHLERLVNFSF